MSRASSFDLGDPLVLEGQNIVDDDDLRPGDHIAVERQLKGTGIQHHGIIVKGKMAWKVIHFTPKDLSKYILPLAGTATVKLEDMSTFTCGIPCVRVSYPDEVALPANVVIDRAYRYLKKQDFGEYHALSNNCEHFATLMKTGKKYSNQAELKAAVTTAAKIYLEAKFEAKWSTSERVWELVSGLWIIMNPFQRFVCVIICSVVIIGLLFFCYLCASFVWSRSQKAPLNHPDEL